MSMFSAIDAEHDLGVVRKAIEQTKVLLEPDRSYSRDEIVTLLNQILTYCERNICE